jgi:YYY domain-containing protein
MLVATRGWTLMTKPEARHLLVALGGFLVLGAAMAGNAVLPLLALLLAGSLAAAWGESDPRQRSGLFLVAAAVTALLACEVVFIRDAYGDRLYRMNTVFKLYFQAWTILAIALPWCVQRLLREPWASEVARRGTLAAVGFLALAVACYPLGITLDRMGRAPTLDGNRYLTGPEYRDDFAAIQWLRDNVTGQPVVLEATGGAYSYFARIASNTGLPTILGWANHEGLWRGHGSEIGNRSAAIDRIYNTPTLAEATPLLDEYDVRYVVVGSLERKQYPGPSLAKFDGLEVAFRSGDVVVYRR